MGASAARRSATSSFIANKLAKYASFIQFVLYHLSRLAATTLIVGNPLLSLTLITNDDRHPVIGVGIILDTAFYPTLRSLGFLFYIVQPSYLND